MTSFNIGTGATEHQRNQDATLYVANIDDRATPELLWELFMQAGPVVNVHVPKDRVTSMHQGYGFVEYMTEEDAEYGCRVFNMIKVFGRPLRVNKASADRRKDEAEAYSANLFVGNLDPEVDEKVLYDTFSAFGTIVQTPKVQRDIESSMSKGFGFVVFDTFEAADMAIEAMNGQYLANKPISVAYAFKKDNKGERHGSAKERELAAQFRKKKEEMRAAQAAQTARISGGAAPAVPAAMPVAPMAAPVPMTIPGYFPGLPNIPAPPPMPSLPFMPPLPNTMPPMPGMGGAMLPPVMPPFPMPGWPPMPQPQQ